MEDIGGDFAFGDDDFGDKDVSPGAGGDPEDIIVDVEDTGDKFEAVVVSGDFLMING